jgi:hypothetical protein
MDDFIEWVPLLHQNTGKGYAKQLVAYTAMLFWDKTKFLSYMLQANIGAVKLYMKIGFHNSNKKWASKSHKARLELRYGFKIL